MKAILLAVLCALVSNVQAQDIKRDTIDKYLINKQLIERFNGSQLEGKTISKYMIAYKNTGNVVERIHVILTESNNMASNSTSGQMKYNGLIIVDGKERSNEDISSLKANEIASVEIYKAGSKVANSYGEKGSKGVMVIITKVNNTSGNVYFIDGKRVEKSAVDKLSPKRVASMSINKKEGVSVIEITTKK